ncbi:hypothetical protein L596_012213 [Steinernema carpocapsae]|uniref:Peptidase S1 domain-containing protein n=1 Tax=Steinernema carpocapsae TaxID=34508 RepID=A0A4U5NX06_STECR|nr:hypothetical protein L596_012213 [Steinernema carpocapsae]
MGAVHLFAVFGLLALVEAKELKLVSCFFTFQNVNRAVFSSTTASKVPFCARLELTKEPFKGQFRHIACSTLTSQFIFTSAHCVTFTANGAVFVGITDMATAFNDPNKQFVDFTPTDVIIHPEFSHKKGNGIALVKVRSL